MIGFIKNWLYRRNAVKVVKKWFEDYEENEQEELHRQVKDWASALKAHVSHYEGFVEYCGEQREYGGYYFTNAKNTAELLIYKRLHAKYGDAQFDVETLDVPSDFDTIAVQWYIEHGKESQLKHRRLYYRIKRRLM